MCQNMKLRSRFDFARKKLLAVLPESTTKVAR
jgi:hypothetical protein